MYLGCAAWLPCMEEQAAYEIVLNDLTELVRRFDRKAFDAGELAEHTGLWWNAIGDTVTNEYGDIVAHASTPAAAAVISQYAPGNIVEASSAKGDIARHLLSLLTNGRHQELRAAAFVVPPLISEYRGVEAVISFTLAVSILAP